MKTKAASLANYLAARLSLVIYILSFSIPFFIGQPQWLVGSIVNSLLFLSHARIAKKEMLPVLILPSLAIITRGILFGPQTIFLYYFLPVIWIGNYLLVLVFNGLKQNNYFLKVVSSSLLKYLFIALFARIYFNLKIVPAVFVASMGYMQLITAIAGGLLAYWLIKRNERKPV